MLEEISFESWYLYLIICGVLYFCTNYLYIQYLNKKLGAKLPGSCKSDGCFGFRSGFEMLKAKKLVDKLIYYMKDSMIYLTQK